MMEEYLKEINSELMCLDSVGGSVPCHAMTCYDKAWREGGRKEERKEGRKVLPLVQVKGS